MKFKIGFVVGAISLLTGCSSAGPYVTNVSSDGNNGLNVEKCSVEFNSFTGTISNTNFSSQHIKLTR
jgi:type IV secretion system protein VirB7